MVFFSPSPHGADAEHDEPIDLQDMTTDELIAHVEELERENDNLRRRSEIEKRRSSSNASNSQLHMPTHTHPDGYDVITHQRVAVLVDVQNM